MSIIAHPIRPATLKSRPRRKPAAHYWDAGADRYRWVPTDDPGTADTAAVEALDAPAEVEPPDHSPDSPLLSLEELVADEARLYAALGTPAGDMICGWMTRLATRVRATGATTPAEFEGRQSLADDAARSGYFESGFRAGADHATRLRP